MRTQLLTTVLWRRGNPMAAEHKLVLQSLRGDHSWRLVPAVNVSLRDGTVLISGKIYCMESLGSEAPTCPRSCSVSCLSLSYPFPSSETWEIPDVQTNLCLSS